MTIPTKRPCCPETNGAPHIPGLLQPSVLPPVPEQYLQGPTTPALDFGGNLPGDQEMMEAMRNGTVAPPRPAPSRLTVVETVYHQSPGNPPVAAECRYSRTLLTDEQCYVRRLRLTEEWVPLEPGWLTVASTLCLQHDVEHVAVNPTPQEKAAREAKVVEIGVVVELPNGSSSVLQWGRLRLGESLRFEPANLHTLRLRAVGGITRCLLTLFPE